MGKSLIINGADFSENAIPSISIDWYYQYVSGEGLSSHCTGSKDNIFGIMTDDISGKTINIAKITVDENLLGITVKVRLVGPYEYEHVYSSEDIIELGSYTITQNDIDRGYAFITFNNTVIQSNYLIGITYDVSDENTQYMLRFSNYSSISFLMVSQKITKGSFNGIYDLGIGKQ